MRQDVLLKHIEARMIECAQSALANPSARDAFEYGRMSGIYAGLYEAKQIVITILDEEDEKNL